MHYSNPFITIGQKHTHTHLSETAAWSPPFFLLPFAPVTNAVPCAEMVGVSNLSGLYSFIRVGALWMLLGYASVFPFD